MPDAGLSAGRAIIQVVPYVPFWSRAQCSHVLLRKGPVDAARVFQDGFQREAMCALQGLLGRDVDVRDQERGSASLPTSRRGL